MNSQHQFIKHSQESESLRFWQTERQTPDRAETNRKEPSTDKLSLSDAAAPQKTEKQSLDLEQSLDANQSVRLLIIRNMIKMMTGHNFKLFSPSDLTANNEDGDVGSTHTATIDMPTAPPENQAPSTGFGLVYEHRTLYQESESAGFSATGSIKTQDGKSIDFSVQLNMSREFRLETSTVITAGDAEKKVDPLVINFNGKAAELSQTRFAFDIDANGSTEQIATLRPGSGLLALDKNKDGIINDGSELFGPTTGNGFAELAKYDSDGNHFIDEADPIYANLRIWEHNEDGSRQLVALGDKNIGAIYLGHVSTPFQLRTANNQSLGEITDTGIYLTEDGNIGTVQQINFSV